VVMANRKADQSSGRRRRRSFIKLAPGITDIVQGSASISACRKIYHSRRGGRDVVLDERLIDSFRVLILLGLSPDRCCHFLGVPIYIYKNWISRAERGGEGGALFKQLDLAVKQAESELQLAILSDIKRKAVKRDSWESDYRYLESRFQGEYNKSVVSVDRDSEAIRVIRALTELLRSVPRSGTIEAVSGAAFQGTFPHDAPVDDTISNVPHILPERVEAKG